MSAQANNAQSQAQAAAARKQSLQQAIIAYGGLPSSFSDQYGDVDQATLDSAGQNQYSTLAQLARSYMQNEEQFKRGLAARGALQSGDLSYGIDQLQNAYGQQRYDAANALGSSINQALGAYTGVVQNNAQNLTGAIQGAESNVFANPAYRSSEPSTADYDAANSATYGQPIYADGAGNLYDLNGNPFTPPSAYRAGGGYDPNAPFDQQPTSVQDAIRQGLPIQPSGAVLGSDVPSVTQPGASIYNPGGILEGAANYNSGYAAPQPDIYGRPLRGMA